MITSNIGNTELEQQAYRWAKADAIRYWKLFNSSYKKNSIELNDIIQDCYLLALELINKYGDSSFLVQRIRQGIKWQLLKLKLDCENLKVVSSNYLKEEDAIGSEDYLDCVCYHFGLLNRPEEDFYHIIGMCGEREQKILKLKFIDGFTLEEIGTQVENLSKQAVSLILKKSLDKIKQEFIKV